MLPCVVAASHSASTTTKVACGNSEIALAWSHVQVGHHHSGDAAGVDAPVAQLRRGAPAPASICSSRKASGATGRGSSSGSPPPRGGARRRSTPVRRRGARAGRRRSGVGTKASPPDAEAECARRARRPDSRRSQAGGAIERPQSSGCRRTCVSRRPPGERKLRGRGSAAVAIVRDPSGSPASPRVGGWVRPTPNTSTETTRPSAWSSPVLAVVAGELPPPLDLLARAFDAGVQREPGALGDVVGHRSRADRLVLAQLASWAPTWSGAERRRVGAEEELQQAGSRSSGIASVGSARHSSSARRPASVRV